MASSNTNGVKRPYLAYCNRRCKCGRNAAIKVSNTDENKHRLFYTYERRMCDFFNWCYPMSGDEGDSHTNETEVNTAEMDMFVINRVFNEVNKRLDVIE